MKTLHRIRPWLLAALCAAAGTSHAAFVSYDTLAAFNAAVTTVGVDSFDDLSNGVSEASPLSRTAGSFAYTATASTQGFFGAGPAADGWLTTDQFSDSITFSGFAAGVNAIGGFFFGSDLFGELLPGQGILLEATDGQGMLSQTLLDSSTQSFFGFVSDGTLISLRISAVQADMLFVWPTVNDLMLGSGDVTPPVGGVPEPASLALALAAMGLLASLRRRPAARR